MRHVFHKDSRYDVVRGPSSDDLCLLVFDPLAVLLYKYYLERQIENSKLKRTISKTAVLQIEVSSQERQIV
jgi:hypothetical protein